MNRIPFFFKIAGGVLFLLLPFTLHAEEKPTVDAEIALLSQYIWRGMAFGEDSVVIQPSITTSYYGVSFNLWSNLDTNYKGKDPKGSELTEADLTISYTKEFKALGLDLGYAYYGADSVVDSQEFYVSTYLNTLLSPTLSAYREVATLQGTYFNFAISHSFGLSSAISLDVGSMPIRLTPKTKRCCVDIGAYYDVSAGECSNLAAFA